jgi:hypothetical protein
MELAMDEDKIVAGIFDQALARVRERGTSEEVIQGHLADLLGGSVDRANPSAAETERVYRELLVCVRSLSAAGCTPDVLVPVLIRHAVELAAMCMHLNVDTAEEARGMLTAALDRFLFLEGVPRPSAPILRLVSRHEVPSR